MAARCRRWPHSGCPRPQPGRPGPSGRRRTGFRQQRLEHAEFTTGRAGRQYQLAEPENRLVVRQPEVGREAALAGRPRLGEEYGRSPRAARTPQRNHEQACIREFPLF